MDHGTWTKESHTVKNRQWQVVKLSPVVMDVMRRVIASTPPSEPYLFPGKVAAKPRSTIRRAWVQILRSAGLAEECMVMGKRGKPLKFYKPKVRIHDLRHSYASWLAKGSVLGASPPPDPLGATEGVQDLDSAGRSRRFKADREGGQSGWFCASAALYTPFINSETVT